MPDELPEGMEPEEYEKLLQAKDPQEARLKPLNKDCCKTITKN
jgi:hypothetical protein